MSLKRVDDEDDMVAVFQDSHYNSSLHRSPVAMISKAEAEQYKKDMQEMQRAISELYLSIKQKTREEVSRS